LKTSSTLGMIAASVSTTWLIEAVMGSTASDIRKKKARAKAKNAIGKKKATKKSKSGSTTVKKKTVAKKKATSAKKVAGKKTTTGKKSSVKKPGAKASKETGAAADGEAALQSDAIKPTVAPDDSKSLSWMAAQAASALKAVRANQTERAQALIAKAEISPAPPAKSRKIPAFRDKPDISRENDGTNTYTEPQKSVSKLTAQPVAEAAHPPAHEYTSPTTTSTLDKTEKPEQTATDPVEQKNQGQPAMEAEPGKAQILPESASLLLVADQNASSSPANEPARIKTGPRQPAEPVEAKSDSAEPVDKTTYAVVQRPEKTAASHTQPDADIKSAPNQPVTQPAAVIAAASTNTRNGHPVRRLLIPGIMVLVGILGILSWLSDEEVTRLATTPVISNLEKPAPLTSNKSATGAVTVLTGKPATKPAAAKVQSDNWSPTSRPGWPESSSYPQRTQASTSSEVTATQGRLPQQSSGVAPRINRPATPRPGYYSPGYGYYPQQPLPQQQRYQPAYSRPPHLQ
jgi:hypothetical protein